jgi:hypothetical protein
MKKNEMAGVFSVYGERRGVYRILVDRPEADDTIWKTQA